MPAKEKSSNSELNQERQWIKASQKDPAAFQNLFDKYYNQIFNYILRRMCNVGLAQDITANTFYKALTNIKKYKWRGFLFSSWLYRIAINEINLYHRKNRRMVSLTMEQENSLKEPVMTDSALLKAEEIIAKNKQFQRLHTEISKLKSKYQNVITLHYFENKTIREIASILNLPENTVKTHLRRGLIKLKELL